MFGLIKTLSFLFCQSQIHQLHERLLQHIFMEDGIQLQCSILLILMSVIKWEEGGWGGACLFSIPSLQINTHKKTQTDKHHFLKALDIYLHISEGQNLPPDSQRWRSLAPRLINLISMLKVQYQKQCQYSQILQTANQNLC